MCCSAGGRVYACFRRRQPLLVAHGVFSLHLVSFVLFSSLILLWIPLMEMAENHLVLALAVVTAGVLIQFTYLAAAVRRFYFANDSRRFLPGLVATASAVLLYVVNSAFVTGTQALGGAMALWSVSR